MKAPLTKLLFAVIFLLTGKLISAQLVVTNSPSALALAQRLAGDGVTISNVTFTGNLSMTGFFNHLGGTNIGIDSGIILTSGRARSTPAANGVNGNGTTAAENVDADNAWGLPGDADLAAAIGQPVSNLEDACILEFDFTPLGDSIKFNYVFSSEEYTPAFVCDFNDAFAFFISGPGITGLKNIALVPNTTIPVSIFNVNNVPGGTCPNNQLYYSDNRFNTLFTHDGHTTILTAKERVQPCQVYHLKLVISDVADDLFDSGVFLQARSLTSAITAITNLTQTDPVTGLSYLVEGCATGAFNIRRARKEPLPLNIQLSYGGSAINGVDVLALPTTAVIPANDSFVTIFVNPVMDLVPEGIET
ncbi:MAG: choice-of-anchor L domain-containing protein, partial [Chitinophagaceae bacterium]|nr:choice-of-anchor L domain-containing protein [Chitinophagaceae bacterium]